MQLYHNQTRQNIEDNLNIFEKDKLNLFRKMEDDLKFLIYGRRPQKQKCNQTNKRKTIIFLKMEDDLNIVFKGRRPQFF
jgi:hypothetical protein